MHVCHLISGDLWAGAEVATWHLLRALRVRDDVSVSAVVLNRGTLATRLREQGLEVEILPEAERGFVSLCRALRRALANADLVHAHRYKESLLAALSGRPWVSTQHGRPEPFRGRAAGRMRLYRGLDLLAKWLSARRVIAVSGEVEDWLIPRVGAEKVVRVWNGIADPLDRVRPVPWSERPRRVGVLGRLVAVKRFDLAIEAVARCRDVELEVVGEGPERPTLERRVRELGVEDRVHLLGHLDDPLPRVASWRALLVTSLYEGNPISVIEALALEIPIVSGPLRGVEEICSERSGWIVQGGDAPQAWAGTLAAILDDESAGCKRSGEARKRYLEAFTADAAAARMARIYAEALAEPPAPQAAS